MKGLLDLAATHVLARTLAKLDGAFEDEADEYMDEAIALLEALDEEGYELSTGGCDCDDTDLW